MNSHGTKAEELIRLEAFLLSERAGHPPGLDVIFWTQAEVLVRGRMVGTDRKTKAVRKPVPKQTAASRRPSLKSQTGPVSTAAPVVASPAKKTKNVKPTIKDKPAPTKPAGKKPTAARTKTPGGDKQGKLDV